MTFCAGALFSPFACPSNQSQQSIVASRWFKSSGKSRAMRRRSSSCADNELATDFKRSATPLPPAPVDVNRDASIRSGPSFFLSVHPAAHESSAPFPAGGAVTLD